MNNENADGKPEQSLLVSNERQPSSRRNFLAGIGASVGVGITGCLGRSSTVEPESDPVCRWNDHFITQIQQYRGDNFAPTRRGALLNLAMFDAMNGVTAATGETHFEPYLIDVDTAPADVSPVAALAGAADEMMTELYGGTLDETFEATVAAAKGGDVGAGESWGRTVATELLTARSPEYTTEVYVPCDDPNQPGCFRRDWNPIHAQIDLWAVDGPEEFQPPGPPSLASETYAESWREVHEKGGRNADRPQEHVDIAAFWRGAPGSPRPPNMWNVIAQTIVPRVDLDLLERVRLFALLSIALADAGIIASRAKYEHGFWRPRTAIHEADRDGNPDTDADPGWEPLASGGSPEYASALAVYGGAAYTVLKSTLGTDGYSFEFGSDIQTGLSGDTTGVSRSYDSLTEALEESLMSRIYVGNHFGFTMEHSRAMGEEIGEWLVSNRLQSRV